MIQEDKELLLKDLCARLPYGVKAQWRGMIEPVQLHSINPNGVTLVRRNGHFPCEIDWKDCRPYLFPLSSMTEEQKEDLLIHVLSKEDCKYFQVLSDGSIDSTDAKQQELEFFNFRWVNFDSKTTSAYIDFCNKNHIDYRNLIGKNLALDATGLNIYD